jgi:hypothetical protein
MHLRVSKRKLVGATVVQKKEEKGGIFRGWGRSK